MHRLFRYMHANCSSSTASSYVRNFFNAVLGRIHTWGANMSRGCALGPPAAAGADACAPAAWPPAAGAAAPSPAHGATDKHQSIASHTPAPFLVEGGKRTQAAAAVRCMTHIPRPLTELRQYLVHWFSQGWEIWRKKVG